MEGPLHRDDDLEYVIRAQDGDSDAFEFLVVRHQKRMLNIAFRMTGSYEDACEVVQDAFVAAFRALKSFRKTARFSTWLSAIVMNTSRNRIKQNQARWRHERISLDEPLAGSSGHISFEIASDKPSATDELERRQLQQAVQKCIDALDEQFREVVVLRDIQGFSYDEIRETLDIVEGTIKSRLFRGRDALRECLKKYMDSAL